MNEWADDFRYGFLHELFGTVHASRPLAVLGDAVEALSSGRPVAFIRHDVDICPTRALNLAIEESEWGVRATYHFMMRSPFYSLSDRPTIETIRQIRALGHEVGLHHDVQSFLDPEDECRRLEDQIGAPVPSMSFHRPTLREQLGPLHIGGRVNAYAAELMGRYLSDSRGRWREGDPRASVAASEGRVLQILVHPEWWGAAHEAPADRLADIADEITGSALLRHIDMAPARRAA